MPVRGWAGSGWAGRRVGLGSGVGEAHLQKRLDVVEPLPQQAKSVVGVWGAQQVEPIGDAERGQFGQLMDRQPRLVAHLGLRVCHRVAKLEGKRHRPPHPR